VFRQAAKSQIIVITHRINGGVFPDLRKPESESDFYFVEADDPEAAVPRIVELVKTRRDIQVLCPMNRGRRRRALAQHRTAGGIESGRRAQGRKIRLDLRARREGHADRERL
jgi:ATP-dependent exoDNAse (exonuclease V) alpha subunit